MKCYDFIFLQDRDTPLHLSAKKGNSEVFEILIKSGASTSAINKVSYLVFKHLITYLWDIHNYCKL